MDRAKTVACLSLAMLAACSRQPHIVVGAKNFTEQFVLGEILAQHLERKLGIPVERKLGLGGTLLAHQALTTGSIDLYPEYTGTALTVVVKQPPVSDHAQALEQVRQAYRSRWQLEWLAPLGFNDTFAMMVRGETARDLHISTLSEAAARQAWRLGAGYEFQQRPDGLAGMLKTYGLRIQGAPIAMDLGLLYQALNGRKVDLIAANSTDGLASVLDVTILADDRHYFPPYDCGVVVRSQALQQFPQLRAALESLSGKISDADMRKLNHQVDGEHRSPADAAAAFLKSIQTP
jgi:glycine betaine/choline ABC-type transport system substrate-binding protein